MTTAKVGGESLEGRLPYRSCRVFPMVKVPKGTLDNQDVSLQGFAG